MGNMLNSAGNYFRAAPDGSPMPMPTDTVAYHKEYVRRGGVLMTSAERAAGRAAGTLDPEYGSQEWKDIYFPEYNNIEPVEKNKMVSNGITITGTHANPGTSAITEPWQDAKQHIDATIGMNREQKQAYFANINYFKNGGVDSNGHASIDPNVFSGMKRIKVGGDYGDSWQLKDGGVMTQYEMPNKDNPYGKNLTIAGGPNGGFEDKNLGYVHQRPDGTKYVPNWMGTARVLGHTSFSPSVLDPLHRATDAPYLNEKAGTNIVGKYGYPPTHPSFTGFVAGQDPRRFGPGPAMGGGSGIPAANDAIARAGVSDVPKTKAGARRALRRLRRLFNRKIPR